LLGRVSELQKSYQVFAALGFGHAQQFYSATKL
jgi:predicted lactoylglutathione lyase